MYIAEREEWIKVRLQIIQGEINRLEKERSVLTLERIKLCVEAMRIDAPIVNIVMVAGGARGTSVFADSLIDDALKELHERAQYIQERYSDVTFEGKHMLYKAGSQPCRMFLVANTDND